MLENIAMIAGDTSRSRVYLQSLARYDLLPSNVILLEDEAQTTLPGQLGNTKLTLDNSNAVQEIWSESTFDPDLPIKDLLIELKIPFVCSKTKDINDPSVVDLVKSLSEAVLIFSGFGGAILRKDILSTGKSFLHVHGGYLPDFKGSTTNYYSLIMEDSMGASSLFLNEEIDSGKVLLRKKFPSPPNKEDIDHIYDSAARAKVLVETIQAYLDKGEWEVSLDENDEGETYYIIHPILKHIAILGKNDKAS